MAVTQKPKEKTFIWTGKDKKGKEIKGEIKAQSDAAARVVLRGRGYSNLKVKQQLFANTGKKIKQTDIAILTRQLATMLKSGVPLIQSFDIVANGNSNPNVTKLLYEIKNDIESGSSLSSAFAKHTDYFDKLYCNLVAAGEKAGILDSILERLATYQEKIAYIKKKIKSAMTYPIAVMGVAVIVTAIIMIFVVPSFKEMFESMGAELPGPTLMVMAISDFFVKYYMLMFGGLVMSIIAFKKALKTSVSFRNNFDKVVLKAPIFGQLLHKSAHARWCRTLATMFSAGVPLVEALDSVAGAAGNNVYYSATKNIQRDVATGQSLTVSMQQQQLFHNMMIQMAQIGEESGSLDDMLNKAAQVYEEEVDTAVESLSSLMEPLIIAFLGVVVGGLVISMYLPIFKMASVV